MNATERDQLQQFLIALRQTRADPKDPVADALIREAVSGQADAPYLLVQRAMGVGLALEAAQTRIQQLEAQSAELQIRLVAAQNAAAFNGSGIGSGIGSGVGGGASGFLNAGTQNWGRAPETPKPPTASMVSAPLPTNRPVGATSATQPVAAQASASAWGGGLMAQVATTAAGVVAGGLLFQGIQSLMGNSAPSSHSPTAKATEEPAPESMAQEPPAGEVADAGDAGDAGDMSWDMGEDWA